MDFLPDVTVGCEACAGRRFSDEVLACRVGGRSLTDVLDAPVGEVEVPALGVADRREFEQPVSVGGADALEEAQERMPRFRRQYKIQEVIKRRQVMLVQVVKEERGNKGAALTTNISFAGRYLVLTPFEDTRGISRKVEDEETRAAMREQAMIKVETLLKRCTVPGCTEERADQSDNATNRHCRKHRAEAQKRRRICPRESLTG